MISPRHSEIIILVFGVNVKNNQSVPIDFAEAVLMNWPKGEEALPFALAKRSEDPTANR